MASPMPLEAPVTTATRPWRSRSMPQEREGGSECERDLAGDQRGGAAVRERDEQCAVVGDPGAGALAVLPAHGDATQCVALAQRAQRAVAVLAQAPRERLEQRLQRRLHLVRRLAER